MGIDTNQTGELEFSSSAPREHTGGLIRIEEAAADEESQPSVPDDRGEGGGGVRGESPGHGFPQRSPAMAEPGTTI